MTPFWAACLLLLRHVFVEVKALCGQLAIFELRSARLVLQLPCHEKAVRDLGGKGGQRIGSIQSSLYSYHSEVHVRCLFHFTRWATHPTHPELLRLLRSSSLCRDAGDRLLRQDGEVLELAASRWPGASPLKSQAL